jgi:DNA-binding transcriptional ArsR family regulator
MIKTPNQRQIVGFLRRHPDDQFYLRELARRLSLDPGNLSRELQVLVNKGLLLKIQEGNLTYFSLRSAGEGGVGGGRLVNDPRVTNYLRRYKSDLVELVQNLVRFPSVPGAGRTNTEAELAAYIQSLSKKLDLFPHVISENSSQPSVIVDLEEDSESQSPPFLLLGHLGTSVVSDVGAWQYNPFSGHRAGGKIYGRGVLATKAGMACELFVLKLIKDLRLDIPVAPRIVLTTTAQCVNLGNVGGVAAIYARGGKYELGIGQQGRLRFKVGVFKKERPEAILALPKIIQALKSAKLPSAKHPLFADHKNVLRLLDMESVENGVELVGEILYLPGVNVGEIYDQLKTLAREVTKVSLSPAVALSPEERIVQILFSACKAVYGNDVRARGTGPVDESSFLIARGIPTVVFGPLGGNAGVANEYVNVNSLEKTVLVYLETLSNF